MQICRLIVIDNIRTTAVAPTTGTYTSSPAYLASFSGALGWTTLKWNQTLNGGTVSFKIQQYTGGTWQDLPGLTNITASGDGDKTYDISSAGTSAQIRIVMTMTQTGTSPVLSNWALTASACTAPTLTAKANNVATTTTIPSGTSVNFTANATGGSNCSDYFEYAWYDGTNYWNGSGFTSNTAVYNTSYNNISYSPLSSAVYTVTARCHAAPTCINTSQVNVTLVAPPAGISAVIGTPANGLAHHLTVSWNTVSGITTYGLEYSTDGLNWTLIGDVSAVTYDFNAGNNPNAPYYFRVRSKLNAVYSVYTSMTSPAYTACDYPSLPTVDNPTGSTLNITLVPETPAVNPAITTYSIYCETSSQYVQANGSLGATEVFQTMAAWGTQTITGLSSNTQYCFYAKARNNDGDIRYQSQISILTPQAFSSDVINNLSSPPTNVWGSPNTCGAGSWFDYNATAGCGGGGGAKYTASSDNFYMGCFLRTPIVNCTGYNEVTLSFDMTNHLDAGDKIDFSCWSVGDNAYNGSLLTVNGVSASNITFNVARNCTHIDAVYSLSGITNKSQLMFYINNNGDSDYGTYNLVIDNFGVNSPTSTSCASTSSCTPGTWVGSVDNDWDDPLNWSCNTLPTTTTNVIIPDVANQPIVSSTTTSVCQSITIEAGASVTVNSGSDLSVFGNWTNNGISDVGTGTVIFMGNSGQTINGATTFGNLTVNNSNGVSINNPTSLTGILTPTLGTLSCTAMLTLESSNLGTALIAGTGSGSVTGQVTMERYMANRLGYHYYSSPFTDAPRTEFLDELVNIYSSNPYINDDFNNNPNPFPNFFIYNEGRPHPSMEIGWDAAGTNLDIMRGYCINFGASGAPVTTTVKNAALGPVNSGTYSFPVTHTTSTDPSADGWNLVGNPYASPIDWLASPGWTKTNVDNAVYCFKPSTQYAGTYTSFVNGNGTNDGSRYIASMQGFFVKASGSGTLGVTNEVRVSGENPLFHKTLGNNPLLRLKGFPTSNINKSDETVIYFDPLATFMFDSNLDAYKMLNNDPTYPNIFSRDSSIYSLSISALPPLTNTDVVIPLGFTTKTSGTYRIEATEMLNFDPSLHIYLEDNQTSTIQDLTLNPQYTFSINVNDPLYRFFIRFSPSILTGIEENGSSFAEAWSSGKDIFVNYSNPASQKTEISIYNMLGQKVINSEQAAIGTSQFTIEEPGCYIVNLISGSKTYRKKVVIL